MILHICLFYSFFVKTQQTFKKYELNNHYNFYDDLEGFYNHVKDKYRDFGEDLKKRVIVSFTEYKKIHLLRSKNNKTVDEFEKQMPKVHLDDKMAEFEEDIKKLIGKYNHNDKEAKAIMLKIKECVNEGYYRIYFSIKNSVKEEIENKKIKEVKELSKIESIVISTELFLTDLYKFERTLLTKKPIISAYMLKNPISEYIPYTESNKKPTNYVNVLLDELERYNLPLPLQEQIEKFRRSNMILVNYLESITNNYQFNNLSFIYKYIIDNNFITNMQTLKDNLFLDNDKLSKLQLDRKNIALSKLLSNFDGIFTHIEMVFKKFCEDYSSSKKSLESDLNEIFGIVNNKIPNKNKINTKITVGERKARLGQCLELFMKDISRLCHKADLDLRISVKELINQIQTLATKSDLTDDFLISKNKYLETQFNKQLKNENDAFFKHITNQPGFNGAYNTFIKLIEKTLNDPKHEGTKDFMSKKIKPYNIEAIIDIINHIENQFTDEKIKNESYISRLDIVNNSEKYINDLADDLDKNYENYNSALAIQLKARMNFYVEREKKLIASLKASVTKGSDLKASAINLKYNKIDMEKESKIESGNNKTLLIVLASIGIILLIIIIIFLIFKIK